MLRFPTSNYIISSNQTGKPHDRNDNELARPLADFSRKISSAPYGSFTVDKQLRDRYVKEIEPLKEQARKLIIAKESNTSNKLTLIDVVERLGISYHFKEEIEEQLGLIHSGNGSSDKQSDLGTVALRFRLFRQHGFGISSHIFKPFTKENGKFQESLRNDIKGLLNLYEASHVRTHGDSLLEEASIFTRNCLSSQKQYSCPSLEKQVKRALQQPLHRGIPRVEARHFISAYSTDKFRDLSLLRLSKLDHNLLQLLHKDELSTLLRWWEEMDLPSKVLYARDGLIPSYFFAVTTCFEPHYALLRILITKFFAVGSFIDDTYDAYSTLDELDLFTHVMHRWDVNENDRLPECVKIAFRAFVDVHEEFDKLSVQQGRPYAFHHVKEGWKEYARNSNIQSKWFLGNELPPFADYMNVGWITSGIKTTVAMYYLAVESANKDVFGWLTSNPPMLVATSKATRLQNDLATHKFEKQRGSATPINCYMKDYNVSEEEAERKFAEMYETCWIDFNEEYCQREKEPLTRDLFDIILNNLRIMDASYKIAGDILSDPEKYIKPVMHQLLMEPYDV